MAIYGCDIFFFAYMINKSKLFSRFFSFETYSSMDFNSTMKSIALSRKELRHFTHIRVSVFIKHVSKALMSAFSECSHSVRISYDLIHKSVQMLNDISRFLSYKFAQINEIMSCEYGKIHISKEMRFE